MKVTLTYGKQNVPRLELIPESDIEHMALDHWKTNRKVGVHGDLVITEVMPKEDE